MRKLRPEYLNRWPEVWNCFRRGREPGRVLSRYLAGGDAGYPFDLALRNGVSVTVENYHDLVTAWVVFFRDEYRLSPRAATILDVGANIGLFSLHAAARRPAARIVAVEPFPSTFARLAANVGRNGLAGRVDCRNVGVARGAGVRVMSEEGPSQSRGILPADWADGGEGEGRSRVEVTSFGDLVRDACERLRSPTIDFVKVDIEGGEHEALLAADPPAFGPIRELGMEYHPNAPKGPLFDHLRSAGLRLVHDRAFGPDSGVAHFRREGPS